MNVHYDKIREESSGRKISRRERDVREMEGLKEHLDKGGSLRNFAARRALVPSTVIYRARRVEEGESPGAWRWLVESPEGLRFLTRIVTAAMYVITIRCGGGVRMVMEFLERSGLSEVVGAGYGTVQRSIQEMEKAIVDIGAEEVERLSTRMPSLSLTLAEDETFHGGKPCLVAMDAVSGYIFVEAYAEDRTEKTWTKVVRQSLSGLSVTVEQCVGDGARALQAHARELGAHASPDLFHIQQDLSRGLSAALRREVEATERKVETADKGIGKVREEAARYEARKRGPGRPIDYGKRIEAARQEHGAAVLAHVAAIEKKELFDTTRKALSRAYHGWDLETGVAVTADVLRERLTGIFARLKEIQAGLRLGPSARTAFDRAQRKMEAMIATMVFVQAFIRSQIDALDVCDETRHLVEERLIPATYIEIVAHKATTADERRALEEVAQRLRGQAQQHDELLRSLPAEIREEVEEVVRSCAERFQRSSSCVEGRNGVLSLRRHSTHRLSEQRMSCLTVVHNFDTHRHDQTTAAKRLFRQPHRDLFEHLLDVLPPPPRPAKRPRSGYAEQVVEIAA